MRLDIHNGICMSIDYMVYYIELDSYKITNTFLFFFYPCIYILGEIEKTVRTHI
uniref:Uncharacterized protein n=1 Tax=Arundo donax TaxID=35708 RepID=A0A0A9G5D5_ARUDO